MGYQTNILQNIYKLSVQRTLYVLGLVLLKVFTSGITNNSHYFVHTR